MFDVAVVGFGPVGAALANLLGARGVRVCVIEREAATYHLPRAVHFDDEVMRIFQGIGLAGAMEGITHASPGMRFVNAAGQLLIDWPRPAGHGPQFWHRSYRFHQPDLERVLRDGVGRFAGVEVRAQSEVVGVEEAADGVRLAVVREGRREAVAARFVVGCDGARSFVRRAIGSELEDLHAHQQWLVVDVILQEPKPELGDFSIQHCDPARPATYVRGTGMRRRWEIMLMPGDDPVEVATEAGVWRLLGRWLGPNEAVIERAAVYTFHAAIARGWRRGRVMIAGDAAHLTPPFLGQGMCAGMRDVANLAWKLDAVLRGAGAGVLDSYERERAAHARDYIEIAVGLGRVIQETDPAVAAARDARMLARPELMRSPAPRLGGHDGRAEPAGRVAPQPVLSDGRLLDDAIGAGFGVLARAGFGAVEGAVVVEDAALRPWLEELGVGAVVVRPDRYVLGCAADAAQAGRLTAWGTDGGLGGFDTRDPRP
jgi:3-(3-hydroxy-phenyl)propionate hydroxylase